MFLLSCVALFAVAALSSPVPSDYTLKLVTVLHGHGARGPLESYPSDPHGDESIWNNGFGQLTNSGKRQMRDLGKWLRKRYGDDLPKEYADRDVYAKATDITRDLMSAYMVLSGLYEPTGKDVWDPEIKWQPIPVHATPFEEEYTLMSVKDCPRMRKLMSELMESDYVKKKFEEFSPKTAEISKMAGYEDNKIVESIYLYDVFHAQFLHGLPLPEWAKSFYPEPLYEMLAFVLRLHAHDAPMKRLTCGPLLKEIVQSFEEKISGNSSQIFREYSGHEATVLDFLRCLDVDDGKTIPPYGAAVLLELYCKHGQYYLVVRYKVGEEVRDLKIPGCDEFCSFSTFHKLVQPLLPDDWEENCRV